MCGIENGFYFEKRKSVVAYVMLTKIDMLLRRLREDKERKKKGSVLFFCVGKKKKTREEGTERKKYQITFFRCGQISQNYFLFLSILAY